MHTGYGEGGFTERTISCANFFFLTDNECDRFVLLPHFWSDTNASVNKRRVRRADKWMGFSCAIENYIMRATMPRNSVSRCFGCYSICSRTEQMRKAKYNNCRATPIRVECVDESEKSAKSLSHWSERRKTKTHPLFVAGPISRFVSFAVSWLAGGRWAPTLL